MSLLPAQACPSLSRQPILATTVWLYQERQKGPGEQCYSLVAWLVC